VLGRWSFDQNGDTSLTAMAVNQVRNGKFEFVKTVEAPR
jgi:branched-chain amino acid transport system substrate-binding protein